MLAVMVSGLIRRNLTNFGWRMTQLIPGVSAKLASCRAECNTLQPWAEPSSNIGTRTPGSTAALQYMHLACISLQQMQISFHLKIHSILLFTYRKVALTTFCLCFFHAAACILSPFYIQTAKWVVGVYIHAVKIVKGYWIVHSHWAIELRNAVSQHQ